MACNVSYMLNLYHTSKYVIENGSINTFLNMPDDGLFVEERLSYEGLISKICMTLGWDPAHVKLHLSLIFDSPGGRRVVKIKNDSHVEFMNRVDPMSCLDLYIDLEDITQEEREASLENVSFGDFRRGERASTSRNRDEEETPLFAQNDYREEWDSDYIAPSESEEDCDVSGESDFEESDDEMLENEERDCNLFARRHVYSKMGNWDASCVDNDEFALKMWDETHEGMDIGGIYGRASSPRTWGVRCGTFNVESEDGEPPCEWKMRVSLKAHGLHEIVRWHDAHNCMTPVNDNDNRCVDASLIARLIRRKVEDNVDYTVASAQKDVKTLLKVDVPYKRAWHGRRKAIEAVYGDWTSNFEELPRIEMATPALGSQYDYQPKHLHPGPIQDKMLYRQTKHRSQAVYENRIPDIKTFRLKGRRYGRMNGSRGSPQRKGVDYLLDETAPLAQRFGGNHMHMSSIDSLISVHKAKPFGRLGVGCSVGRLGNPTSRAESIEQHSRERFREKREDDNLLDEELDKHLDDIINQTHAALTLGANDEMEVDDTQILVDKDPFFPSQPPPGKKAKPWSRDKIGGGRKRKVTIPPRTSQQQTEGQQNEDQAHSSRGSRIQVETHFEEAGGPETQFDIGGPETQFDIGGLETQFGGQANGLIFPTSPQPLCWEEGFCTIMALTFAQYTLFTRPSLLSLHRNGLKSFALSTPSFFSVSFSTSALPIDQIHRRKWRQPVASVLELGGVKVSREEIVRDDPTNNVPDTIFSKLGMQLHRRDQHPIGILKNAIYDYFDTNYPNKFEKFDNLFPVVSVKQNFDDVLVPADHVSRSYNDTYYVDSQTVLRCHTSAHQAELLRKGHNYFLVTGDVYRRDSIDSTHYPVFHQMEGFRVFAPNDWEGSGVDGTSYAALDLKNCLEGLARHLFGAVEMRWVDTYFPFTNPSFELEIYFQEKWMEVLGCGVTEQEILKNCGRTNNVAWAFGLGLERLAMVLFDIPDIRLFWSSDERFTSQFSKGKLGMKFKPFSKYPPCYKDMSFWINDSFTENNLCEVVRGVAGDLAEEVKLIDNFTNKKGMTSHCYRITFRSMERSLTDEEINALQLKVREQVESKLNVVLR
ncbi:OLC1v1025437C1 [Oldenlandia corymbosa var. corymbosa]|uniref:phenylalanine--tRNA ligase n=1 Tax=Oldenlandia corymbosa var. corymbosa TaxID=529605 RepID=A0AAV1C6G8_OLDCO|nr:OLC1v1025437C1 [Oldenlandia corymbosa var. corymbosa]